MPSFFPRHPIGVERIIDALFLKRRIFKMGFFREYRTIKRWDLIGIQQKKNFLLPKMPWRSSLVESLFTNPLLMQNTHRKVTCLRVLRILSIWADSFNQYVLTWELCHTWKYQQWNEEVDLIENTVGSAPLQSGG